MSTESKQLVLDYNSALEAFTMVNEEGQVVLAGLRFKDLQHTPCGKSTVLVEQEGSDYIANKWVGYEDFVLSEVIDERGHITNQAVILENASVYPFIYPTTIGVN